MNMNALKKAFLQGIPAAAAAWVFYGLFTSLFDDDPFLEQMFESSGILFGICMAVIGVCFFYRKAASAGETVNA